VNSPIACGWEWELGFKPTMRVTWFEVFSNRFEFWEVEVKVETRF
jgi:hypothetical protein